MPQSARCPAMTLTVNQGCACEPARRRGSPRPRRSSARGWRLGPSPMSTCASTVILSGTPVLSPSTAASGAACTDLVVLSADEYANWQNNPLNLSASDGLALSVAILSVWGTAFAWVAVKRALGANDGEEEKL